MGVVGERDILHRPDAKTLRHIKRGTRGQLCPCAVAGSKRVLISLHPKIDLHIEGGTQRSHGRRAQLRIQGPHPHGLRQIQAPVQVAQCRRGVTCGRLDPSQRHDRIESGAPPSPATGRVRVR